MWRNWGQVGQKATELYRMIFMYVYGVPIPPFNDSVSQWINPIYPRLSPVMKLDLTTRFPSFFPTFWYQFRLLLCYHMTPIYNGHVITSLCHYDVTTNTHIMWPVPYIFSHSMTLSLLLHSKPLYLSIRTTSLLDVLLASLLLYSKPLYLSIRTTSLPDVLLTSLLKGSLPLY